MTRTRTILSLGLLAGLLAGTASVQAGETVMFNGPAPQAAELAKILWPSKQRAQAQVGATRSIRINADMSGSERAAPRPTSHVDVAATEPEIATDAVYEQPSAPQPDAFGFQIHFGYDSAEILPESRPYLDSVGAMLRLPEAKDRRVRIVGHTDAKGTEQYNQKLSERRAATVRAYLSREFGIAPERLEVAGEGESKPLTGSDPYAAQNRRVEFHAAG